MEAIIIVLLTGLLAVAGVGVWHLLAQRRPDEASDQRRLEEQRLQDQRLEQQLTAMKGDLSRAIIAGQQTVLAQVNAVDGKLNQRLDSVHGTLSDALRTTTETIGSIDKQLGELGQSTQRILEVGKDVSSLKDVLQPPKLRGGFGELLLEQLVRQVLPPDRYSTQHRFRDGTVVDLVIHSPEGLVPVDSKFPIESFRRLLEADTEEAHAKLRKVFVRDVKMRIQEVVKYIRPEDNTLDFALMYVPAENVYYETISGTEDESPMTFALERGVHLCSPNTFHAFLQIVLRGFRGLKVQEEAKEIMGRLAHFQRQFAKFRHDFEVLGGHVGRAKSKYDELDKLAERLSDRLEIDIPVQATLPEPPRPEDAQRSLPEPSQVPAEALPGSQTSNGHDEAP